MHGRGDRAVSADQLKGLVPGARMVEQGRDDRIDVGAGDRATEDRRGYTSPAAPSVRGRPAGAVGIR